MIFAFCLALNFYPMSWPVYLPPAQLTTDVSKKNKM